jgi:APA family basic amino acid/polyamine antiporter
VPRQTSLSQDLEFEEERVARQQELLDSARDIAEDLDIRLQTRAIVGRNAGSVILDVIDEVGADHVLLGWQGTRSRREYVLGSTIDPVIGRAPCDATLVKLGTDGEPARGQIMALAGQGPHAPVALRRAGEFVNAAQDTELTVVNVQPPGESSEEDELSPTARGETLIDEVAQRAGIEDTSFDSRVVVAEDIKQAILELTDEYGTICVGATRSSAVSQALFGSLPERIGTEADGTVVIARGPEQSPMSIREAIARRLED